MRAKQETGWRCPQCGRRFLQRTREHSCDVRSLAAHLDRASPGVRDTFTAIQDLLTDIGPHNVIPVKTMILFRVRRNFGGVVVRRDTLDLAFFLPRQVSHPRIYKTEPVAPRKYAHHVKLSSPADVDDEVRAWLREAHQVGA